MSRSPEAIIQDGDELLRLLAEQRRLTNKGLNAGINAEEVRELIRIRKELAKVIAA